MTPLLLGQVSRVSQSLMLMSALLLPGQVIAQATPNTIKDVTLQALDGNPEVQAAWHEFKAATQDVRVARGGYLPTVDIGASAGKTNRDYDGRGVYNTTQG
ncbi:MAG TPA: TolC family protein, partial [Cellvibrio sp.]